MLHRVPSGVTKREEEEQQQQHQSLPHSHLSFTLNQLLLDEHLRRLDILLHDNILCHPSFRQCQSISDARRRDRLCCQLLLLQVNRMSEMADDTFVVS